MAIAVVLMCVASGVKAADDDAGHAQFLKSCGTCHSAEAGAELRQGPNLHTVFGRKAGTLQEFPDYSDALKKAGASGLVWNEETLDKWITSAGDYIADVKMFYAQPDPEKRKLVIDYLKGLAGAEAK